MVEKRLKWSKFCADPAGQAPLLPEFHQRKKGRVRGGKCIVLLSVYPFQTSLRTTHQHDFYQKKGLSQYRRQIEPIPPEPPRPLSPVVEVTPEPPRPQIDVHEVLRLAVVPTRPVRNRRPPKWFADFECHQIQGVQPKMTKVLAVVMRQGIQAIFPLSEGMSGPPESNFIISNLVP